MQKTLTRLPWLLVLLGLSCQQYQPRIAALEAEVQALKSQVQFQAEEKEDILRKLSLMEARIENEVRGIYARLNCTNTQVAEFLAECEQDSDVCSPKGTENALLFMATQPYVTLYLVPEEGFRSITMVRKGQLAILSDPKSLHPSSRFLVLVQPREESAASTTEALDIGRGVSRYLRSEVHVARGYKVLGPKALPCKLKADKLSRYMGRLDRVGNGEPADPAQRVRVWVFRTDC